MIDTHAHLFDDIFDSDLNEVILNAKNYGIESIIMPAIEPKTFKKMYSIVEKYNNIYCSIGIHPHNSKDLNEDVFEIIESYTRFNKVVAIGEIGLDYYYDFSPKETQIYAFRKQIELAKKCQLPIIVHNRDSDSDIINILKDSYDESLKGVLHCFSGDSKMLNEALNLGFYVSFTGNITFSKAEALREIVREAPLESILLETDSPWMSPVPNRGKRNEPKNLNVIAEKIAEIKNIKIDEVIRMTTQSAQKLFKLATFILVMFALSNINELYSQDEEEMQSDSLVQENENPYFKLFGIAPIIGTNTVVNTYKPNGEDRSQDGLLTYGFGIYSNPIEWVFLEFAYLHFEDKVPYENTKKQTDPEPLDIEQHNMYEFGGGFILNPAGRVNFYGITGYSFQITDYSMYVTNADLKYVKQKFQNSRNGIFTGLGFFANLPIEKAGNFVLNAEWRLNFLLENTVLNYDPRLDYRDPNYDKKTEYSTFFSIPRISVIWYPPLDEWLGF